MPAQSKHPTDPLDLGPSEFDFSKVPDNELECCLNYEIARESDAFKKKAAQTDQWPGYSRFLQRLAGTPEFPATPWIDLPATARSKLYSLEAESPQLAFPGLKWWPLDEFLENYMRGIRVVGSSLQGKPPSDPNLTFVIEVDVRETDTSLRKQFDQWLSLQRHIVETAFPDRKHPYRQRVNRRGKRRNYNVYRNHLEALGWARQKRAAKAGSVAAKQFLSRRSPGNVRKKVERVKKLISDFESAAFRFQTNPELPLRLLKPPKLPEVAYSPELRELRCGSISGRGVITHRLIDTIKRA